jgi:ATP-dependent DNA helicase 2 subunit 2
LKYRSERGLKLIGFTKRSQVPRHHYMGPSTEVIAPDPADTAASTAISGLVRAMIETESVAIIRYSKREDSVKLAVLVPHISGDSEFFYIHKLPFAEDLRHFPFAPLDPELARPCYVPSVEQLSAVDDLIDALDLSTAAQDEDEDSMEALKPKHTYNPVLQRFYQTLQLRALNPECKIIFLSLSQCKTFILLILFRWRSET